jgi:uncharacterized membrane protein
LANNAQRAVIWQNGTLTNLGTLGGSFSAAEAINSSGQVVGLAAISQGNLPTPACGQTASP